MSHNCHWPGCKREVGDALWGCTRHWAKLPARLRNRIWSTTIAGQDITELPSLEYLQAAHDVQTWISSDSSPEARAMDGAEVARLCDELNALVKLGPAVNPEALSHAKGIIETFRAARSGGHVGEMLVGIDYGFEQWFSADKWNRQSDGGRGVKCCLRDDILSLKKATARGWNEMSIP
jgi:hypothetical protein